MENHPSDSDDLVEAARRSAAWEMLVDEYFDGRENDPVALMCLTGIVNAVLKAQRRG